MRSNPHALRAAFLPMIGLLLASVLMTAAPDARAQRRTLTVSAAELTAQLASRFPQRRCLLGLACVTLENPRVQFRNGDPRLFLTARAGPEFGTQPLNGGVMEVAGKPRYDAARGAFFIDAPEVLRLEFPDLPPAYVQPATELSRGLLVDYLRQTPVWVLDEKDAQQAMARLVLRQVEVKGGALHLVIGDDD